MRFAGHQIEDYFAGPNMGKLVGGAEQINAREKAAGIQAQGQVASAAIHGDATKKAGEIIGDAQADAARAAMWGQVFQTVGQVAGAGMGAMKNNSYGGTGSTGGAGDTVRVGDTGKYGTFQDPMITFNKMGYTYDPSNGLFNIPRS